MDDSLQLLLFAKAVEETVVLGIILVVIILEVQMLHNLLVDQLIVLFLLGVVAPPILLNHAGLFIFFVDALGPFVEVSPLLLDFVQDKLIIFSDFFLEILSVLEGLVNLLIQDGLILYFLKAILQELLGKLLDFLNFLVQVLNCRLLQVYHFLQVVALEHQVGDALFVLGFVLLAYFDQHIQPLMLQQRVGVLILYLLYLGLDLLDFLLRLHYFLLVLGLVVVVLLDDLQLF